MDELYKDANATVCEDFRKIEKAFDCCGPSENLKQKFIGFGCCMDGPLDFSAKVFLGFSALVDVCIFTGEPALLYLMHSSLVQLDPEILWVRNAKQGWVMIYLVVFLLLCFRFKILGINFDYMFFFFFEYL